jgi:hypothetical protein
MQFSSYYKQVAETARRQLLSGPMTVVLELRSGRTITKSFLEGRYNSNMSRWDLENIEVQTDQYVGDTIDTIVVYDDFWNEILIQDNADIVLTTSPTTLSGIGVRWEGC